MKPWAWLCLLILWPLNANEIESLSGSLKTELAKQMPLIGLDIKALNFKRDLVKATGRLAIADQGLMDPLAHISWMERTEVVWGQLKSYQLPSAAAKLLDLKFPTGRTRPSSPLAVFSSSDREQVNELLDSIPEPARKSLGDLLAAMKQHRDRHLAVDWSQAHWRGLRSQVDGDYTDDNGVKANDKDVETFLGFPEKIRNELLVEDIYLLSLLSTFKDSVQGLKTNNIPNGKKLFETSLGWIAIGGSGNDVYDRSCALIVDFGGDDKYLAPCAAANPDRPASFVVDVRGDDLYKSSSPTQGSGLFGCGVLIDLAGDDTYIAPTLSQGCGVLGLGLLIDEKGDDVYRSRQTSQAHGAWGIGILVDEKGKDLYRGGTLSQALARTQGIAILQDRDGEDHYILGDEKLHKPLFDDHFTSMGQGIGYGYRYQNLAGGLAILHDLGGNDTYNTDIYGQGAGYWYGCGHLWDRAGNDRYQCTLYGIGAGIHLAAGYVYDKAGNDSYHLNSGIGVGGAHDYAVGVLLDVSGDDQFMARSTALGGAINNSLGMLVDWSGNDIYMVMAGQGRVAAAKPSRHMPSLGIQVDFAGEDQYRPGFGDDQVRGSRSCSLSIDVNSKPPVAKKEPE